MRHLLLTIYFILTASLLTPVRVHAAVASHGSLDRLGLEQLMARGRHSFECHEAEDALACFNTVINRTNGEDTKSRELHVRALNNVGCVHKYLYFDYIRSYEYFMQAYQLCEEYGYDDFLPIIMVNLGDLLSDFSSNHVSPLLAGQSKDILDKCMQRAYETKNWELLTTTFFNLSNQNYDLPLAKYKTIFAKEIPDSTPDIHYVRLLYKGLEAMQQGEYAEARHHFQQQLGVVSARWEPERDTLATYLCLAQSYRMEGKYRRETEYLERAFQLASDREVDDQVKVISHLLTEARASELSERQFLQQMVILVGFIVLSVVMFFALLLWRKNKQLNLRNRSLYLKNRQLLEVERTEQQLRKELETNKYRRSSLNDEQRSALIFRIQDMLDNPEVICQSDFTLAKLAKMADSNTTYVSQVINEKYGSAFSNVLSGFRIKEACRRMSDETSRYSKVTIEAIALGVGFRSRTAFINAFKREVGLTPSEYLRQAQSQAVIIDEIS